MPPSTVLNRLAVSLLVLRVRGLAWPAAVLDLAHPLFQVVSLDFTGLFAPECMSADPAAHKQNFFMSKYVLKVALLPVLCCVMTGLHRLRVLRMASSFDPRRATCPLPSFVYAFRFILGIILAFGFY